MRCGEIVRYREIEGYYPRIEKEIEKGNAFCFAGFPNFLTFYV